MNKLIEKLFSKPDKKESPIQEFFSSENKKKSEKIYKEIMRQVDKDQKRIINLVTKKA